MVLVTWWVVGGGLNGDLGIFVEIVVEIEVLLERSSKGIERSVGGEQAGGEDVIKGLAGVDDGASGASLYSV